MNSEESAKKRRRDAARARWRTAMNATPPPPAVQPHAAACHRLPPPSIPNAIRRRRLFADFRELYYARLADDAVSLASPPQGLRAISFAIFAVRNALPFS